MKRFLNFTLGEIGNDILKPREVVDFKQIFHDLDTQNPSPTQRKEFEKMFSDFKKYQSAPELETLRELLFVYRGVSGARKKEILSALDANIPLSLAIQTKIVSHERLADIATSTFGALYTDLDTQNRDKFLEAFSHPAMEETPILLSMKDVNEEKLG